MYTMLLLLPFASIFSGTETTLTESTFILPTYETQPPDRVPLFYRPEEVQLAEKHVYPYPFYDVQSVEKVDKEYKAVLLENEYLKLCITPQMGGRLYYALDKTNNYDLVYYNHVVKPALIGTIGAWTSGGVEWNTPHHHRATSLIDVDYALVENKDGSKTVWVGEYEKRSQTRWLTGMTLEPGKAYVKIDFKSLNVTPFQYPALYFANIAVHVNDRYQFIFPPDVEMMNFHYVTEFTRWPVLNQVYQSTDYTHGEDLSWWKETRQPVSFFVTQTRQDFMGGIDHGKRAGIAVVGDHRIFKGKKLWNWGKNEVQKVWDQKLTDDDGPYAELMMGFYSDNQPDYNFVAPFETKYGTMYLYGLKGMSGIKEANRDCAINLELKQQRALIQVNVTSIFSQAKVLLFSKDTVFLEERADLSPSASYETEVEIGDNFSLEDVTLAVYSQEGAELIAWQKQPELNEAFPEPYRDPLDPRDYTTSQDAFFAGLKLEQFGNTNFDYMEYYEAAITLHPNDLLTNTQLGQIYSKRREYDKAEEHLTRSVEVVTGNHTKAEDATSLYYLGVCFMKQGRVEEALDCLYRATWAYEWTSAGYTLIARLEGSRNQWDRAIEAAERACKANTQNVEAILSRVIALRQLEKHHEALAAAQSALEVDPLFFAAMNEIRLLSASIPVGKNTEECTQMLVAHLRNEPCNYIETATRYSQFGLYRDAAEVMRLAAQSDLPALNAYPMTHYHLGLYQCLAGEEENGAASLSHAASLPIDLCFPYGDESVKTLLFALSKEPEDATACYLLGNALANHQHQEAVSYWEQAARHNSSESLIYRNIAYLQANHLRNMPDALNNIMQAISLNPSEPRYFSEAHLYMSYASLTPQQLAKFLEKYGAMGRNITDLQLMQINLDIFTGNYDRAIELMRNMQYHIKEGASFNPHVYWFDAHLHKGVACMNQQKQDEAENCFLTAMEFPVNLEAERNGKIGIAYYYLGLNRKLARDGEKAAFYFKQMIDYTYSQGWGAGDFPELSYFKALAMLELGQNRLEAETLFRQLIHDGEARLIAKKDSRHITVSVDESHAGRTFLLENELAQKGLRVSSYYMQGLGHLGLGDTDKAKTFFEKALEVNPLAVDPKRMLESILP